MQTQTDRQVYEDKQADRAKQGITTGRDRRQTGGLVGRMHCGNWSCSTGVHVGGAESGGCMARREKQGEERKHVVRKQVSRERDGHGNI